MLKPKSRAKLCKIRRFSAGAKSQELWLQFWFVKVSFCSQSTSFAQRRSRGVAVDKVTVLAAILGFWNHFQRLSTVLGSGALEEDVEKGTSDETNENTEKAELSKNENENELSKNEKDTSKVLPYIYNF